MKLRCRTVHNFSAYNMHVLFKLIYLYIGPKIQDLTITEQKQNILAISKLNTNIYICFIVVCLMVLNATFNNISVISWRSVLLVEETGEPRENHRPVTSQ